MAARTKESLYEQRVTKMLRICNNEKLARSIVTAAGEVADLICTLDRDTAKKTADNTARLIGNIVTKHFMSKLD